MLLDADIVLNGQHKFRKLKGEAPKGKNAPVAYDLQNTITHEMGHNLGCGHCLNQGGSVFPHSYGYRNTVANRSTLMCGGATKVMYWSGPNVKYLGHVMGTASENAVLSHERVKATVAAFTPTKTLVWEPLSGGIKGAFGVPTLTGAGTITNAAPITLTMRGFLPLRPGVLLLGGSVVSWPFFGGTLVPAPDLPVFLPGTMQAAIVFDASARIAFSSAER